MYDYFMEKYIYQMFILGCENPIMALSKGLGGVIFFTKDIDNENELVEKINNYKSASLIPPFISIDQEGGRVERTEKIRSKRLSARFAFQKGEVFLQKQSEEISQELADWGFNLNFAPCIDVNTNPNNPIIGERAFSDKTEEVIKGSEIFITASRKSKVVPCVKHFPGHGDADKDSHLTLPQIDLSLQNMKDVHISPFISAIKNDVEMIMVAHLHCTCFDGEIIPASLSKNVVGYLRNELSYQGVVITDDMVMQGVQDFGSLEACVMAIKAGVDMFIFRNSNEDTLNLIDKLVNVVENDYELQEKVVGSFNRIMKLKQRYNLL